jgi:hypothetical protein
MKIIVILFSLFLSVVLQAQIYVSPNGSDTNPGTIDLPYKTPQKALTVVTTGGLIYVRGGVYNLTTQVKPNTNGTELNYCKMWAYPGETPIFDFTGLNDRGLYISKSYWHIRGIEVRFAGNNGICFSTGGFNIVEGCVSHDNQNEGIKFTNGSHDNLVLNCDSYRNYDPANHGENADGFSAKSGVSTGNKFKGCRGWWNSDDGWDFYGCPIQVIIDSCFAFKNGVNIWGDVSFQGDGNAYKLGGAGDTATHIVRNSVAFDNVHKGFDQNHSTSGMIIYNCTGYRNTDPNFSLYETPAGGKKHILKNNVSHRGTVSLDATAIQEKNSWLGFVVTDADFISVDTALALAPRNADYTLPKNGFLRLKSGSSLIDAGVNVGLPYYGSAPDLGAFEFNPSTDVDDYYLECARDYALSQNYPNPFNPTTTINYQIPARSLVTMTLTNTLGEMVKMIVNEEKDAGNYSVQLNASDLKSGVYFYTITAGNFSATKKLILMK